MDYEEDFIKTVQETVALLKKRWGDPREYSCKDLRISGWMYDQDQKSDDEMDVEKRYFRDGWQRTEKFITSDGDFYTFYSYRTEEIYGNSPIKIESGEYWRKDGTSSFVGVSGKPFSKSKAFFERLPYTR